MHQAKSKVLVWDGAMGTMIQAANLQPEDFAGLDGCNEYLVHTRPELIRTIHEAYFAVGADVVETNTFGGTPVVLVEYDLQSMAFELNEQAAKLARQAADKHSTKAWPRFVAGSIGPGTKLITLGHVSYEEMYEGYKLQAGRRSARKYNRLSGQRAGRAAERDQTGACQRGRR